MSSSTEKLAFMIALIFLSLSFSFVFFGIHRIDEGFIGVYWIGGALQQSTSGPGFHVMIPFITKFAQVQLTLQTDTVKNIPCGTSGGVLIYFDTIEVVNRLRAENAHKTVKLYGVDYDKTWIFDRIHHEINQFCSSHSLQEVYIDQFETLDEALAQALQDSCDRWDTGIEIIGVRVTKPRIPESVRKNYEEVETAKTRLLLEKQKELVAKKEEEIAQLRATIQAEKEAMVAQINAEKIANVSRINMLREIAEKEAELKKETIQNQIALERQKAATDAETYQIEKTAEANQKKYTEEYLRYVLYTSLANNTKIYFGEKIPNIFLDFLTESSKEKIPLP